MESKRASLSVTELVFKGIAKIGSEYDFAVLSAVRALQIQAGLPPLTRSGSKSCLERTMEEIGEGKIEIKPKEELPLD